MKQPMVLGIGGTMNRGSSTECALRHALGVVERQGVATRLFAGEELSVLPYFDHGVAQRSAEARSFVAAIRAADGFIVASPGFHGTISGLVKNALDYIEETAKDDRVYLDGAPIGLIVTAFGWQATGSTLLALRSVAHALRGWPTPFGACVKTCPGLFVDGGCSDPAVKQQLETVGRQVVDFLSLSRARLAIT